MRKTQSSDRRLTLIKISMIALLIVFLVAAALLAIEMWDRSHGKYPELNFGDDSITYNGKNYTKNQNIETFLVIGLDKFDNDSVTDSYTNNMQADFLMLFIFDNEKQTASAIHINRDTMANINVLGVAGNKIDTVNKQIALSHTYGNGREVSCRNTADAVSDLLSGIKIDHYISVTMNAVTTLNDLVGGVEVTIEDDFSGIDDTLVKGEKVTLLGEHAMNFIRTRQGLDDSTNIARMKRQKLYLKSLYEKAQQSISADNSFIVNSTLQIADNIVSDRSVTQLQELIRKFNSYEFNDIRNIEGTSTLNGEYMEFKPDVYLLQKMIVELFYVQKSK